MTAPRSDHTRGRTVALTQAQRVANSRSEILRAAMELFAERGFEATTTGAIADRAGFARSMVNTRFGSKDGLLAAMLDDNWITELLSAITAADSGLDAIQGILARLRKFVTEEPIRLRAFLVVSFEAAGPSTIPVHRIAGPLADLRSAIQNALSAGKIDGSIAVAVDPDHQADRILDIGLGMAYRWLLEQSSYDFAGRIDAWQAELGVTLREAD